MFQTSTGRGASIYACGTAFSFKFKRRRHLNAEIQSINRIRMGLNHKATYQSRPCRGSMEMGNESQKQQMGKMLQQLGYITWLQDRYHKIIVDVNRTKELDLELDVFVDAPVSLLA